MEMAIVQSSDNGANWSDRSYIGSDGLYDVAYGNGVFVAVGYKDKYGGNESTAIFSSSDNGTSWNQSTFPFRESSEEDGMPRLKEVIYINKE
jgi:hypothetical protein